MLYRDTDLSRQLVGERHAQLKQDWRTANAAAAAPVETLSDRRSRFAWVRAHLRSARRAPARHAS
jgi:hypothetical protein